MLSAFDANEFLKYVAAMLAILNPITKVPLVIAFTPDGDRRERLVLAAVATATVFITLSVAALFGERILKDTKLLVAEATFAVGRYQVEEPSFHPYDSKYDYWL